MKSIYALFVALIFGSSAWAQEEAATHIQFPEKLPHAYQFDAHKEFNDVKKESAKLLPASRVDQFAEQMTAMKIRSILSGDVYIGWDEMENYLNTVLKQILPDSLKKNPHVHIYPARNSEFNAFAIHDGSIFFNVSLFAEVTNEAAIAFILGHELSHYIHRDVIKSFKKREEIEVKKEKGSDDSYYSYQVELSEYNKDQERSADSLGAVLAAKAGYDINYAIGSFYKFKNFTEQSYEKANSERINMARKHEEGVSADSLNRIEDQILSTHPDELSRIKSFKNYVTKLNKPDAKEFITDQKALFTKLQEASRFESLDILLNELEFRECTSRAFTYYLLQGNDRFLFYLLESMRRCFEIYKFLPGKPFLTEDLRAGIFQKGEGVLHNLHAQIRDTSDYKKIKPSPLTNTKDIAFETWDEAFNYFADLAIEKNYVDGYLPIALRNSDTIPLRNFYLDKYLEKPNRQYSAFAKAVKEDKLIESLNKNSRRLVLFNDMLFTYGVGDDFQVQYFHSLEVSPGYSEALDKMVSNRFDGKEYIDESDLKQKSFRQFYQYDIILNAFLSSEEILKKAFNTSDHFKDNSTVKENTFNELFFLNPDLWNIFKENNIRSVHYLKAVSYKRSNAFLSWMKMRNYYSILTCYGDIQDGNNGIYFDQDQVLVYKMSKSNFLNTVYHNIKLYNEK